MQRSIAAMSWQKIGRRYGAGVAWLCAACGEAPPPPTALMDPTIGAEAAGGTSTVILGAQPPGSEDVPDAGAPPPAADASAPPAAPAEPSEGAEPSEVTGGGPTFAGCTAKRLDCDEIFVTVLDGELCVQLSLDNCNAYARPGLPADVVPLAWRLASAVLVPRAEECEPLEAYPGTVPVANATGTIDWNDEGLVPSDLQIDVSLSPSQAIEGSELLPESVAVATTLAGPLPECAEP